jgi:lipoprotein signal peptidase
VDDPSTAEHHSRRAAYSGVALRSAVVLATTAVLTAIDQASKGWAFREFGIGRASGRPMDFLRFTCHMNKGTAWGFCSGGHWYGLPAVILLIGTALAAIMAIAVARFEPGSILGKVTGRCKTWLAHGAGASSEKAAPRTKSAAASAMLDAVAFSLLVSGALGNAIDRFNMGSVVDFIDVGIGTTRWPTFNVADACLVVGIYMVLTGALADLVPRADDHREDGAATERASSPLRIFFGVASSAAISAVVMAVVGRGCEQSLAVHRAVVSVLSYLGVGVVTLLLYGYARLELRRLRSQGSAGPPPGAET